MIRARSLTLVFCSGLAACSGGEASSGGTGTVEGTIIDLSAAISERVTERAVREGDAVEEGAVLLRLDCRRLDRQLEQLDARIASAQAELAAAAARVIAAAERARSARLRASAGTAEVDALGAQQAVAARDAKRVDQMGKFVPESERDRAETRAAQLGHQVEAARRQTSAAGQDVRAAEAEVAASEAQKAAIAANEKALQADRARLLVDVAECTVTSPRAGYVEELFFEVGEMVPAGAPLARIVDLDDVWVTFYLPNDELGDVAKGSAAEVRADAYPGEVFSGEIATIATEAEFTPRNIQTRDDRSRLVYPIEVRLENPDHRLRPGMPVEVEIVGAAP